ncbi:MAG: MFS transporter [Actinomycetota bacterium]|nr:MFS transporter [Actinomycetota bacterium]
MTTAVPGASPALVPFDRESRSYQQRWWILLVLCMSLLVIIVDNTILNVAVPTIVTQLDASTSQLQWMVDSYTLVFAGLLLTAGSLGDRFGRRGALQVGMVIFGLGSLLAATSDSAGDLILYRGVMGVGGAFIMPATLSIITNVFPPEERGKAIGLWAAVAGVAGVVGPTTGGFLLEHFYWGSIFLVNIPIVIVALAAGFFLIPTSRDPSKPALDPLGALLSIVGLVSFVYAIIQAPEEGWTSPMTLGVFAFSIIVLAGFALWERTVASPMLDTSFWRDPRFSAASGGIALIFFAMFGSIFLLTQYFQFVMGYSAFEAGVRLLPWALTMLIVAPNSARLAHKYGTKVVVGSGLSIAAFSLALLATLPGEGSSYWGDVVWRMVPLAFGMALTMAPATESIMGSLPRAKAGVGSAVNDTTRQIGGAFGVAIIGSVMASVYGSRVADSLAGLGVEGEPADVAKEGLGQALRVAQEAPGSLGPQIASVARDAFMEGMHRGVLVGSIGALIGALVVFKWLPARAADALEQRGEEVPVPAEGEQ